MWYTLFIMLTLNSTVTLGSLFSWGIFTSESSKLIVRTEHGKLKGTTSTGRDGRTIYEFLGIPYAAPPVGELRFSPPEKWNITWNGVRDASKYGPDCKQFHLIFKFIWGSEDCLFLNVYTHQLAWETNSTNLHVNTTEEEKLVPVIVYFHGGFFMHGSGGLYKPKYLLESNVILVTINYRLGVLGFLNLGAENITGNAGLKDQVAALKWVQHNIRNFGGNPNKVTIMGESAGAVCVHYHILSKMSLGLFHRAISQSGNAFVSWASQDHPQEQALKYAERMKCLKATNAETAKCLRNLDANKIAKSQRYASDVLHDRYAMYAPTIELPGEDAFISDLPQNIVKSGNFSKVPWLVGANSAEGLIYSAQIIRNETLRTEINKNWTTWIPILGRFEDEPNKDEIADEIRSYYLGNSTAEVSMSVLNNVTTFLSDRAFFEGLHNSLELHRGQHPIYPYIYAYEGVFSYAKLLFRMTYALPTVADIAVSTTWNWFLRKVLRVEETSYGVGHGDELPLLFNIPFLRDIKEKGKTREDYKMSQTLVEAWTSFATDGIPSPINDIIWPVLSESVLNTTRDIDAELNAGSVTSAELGKLDKPIMTPIKFIKINKTSEIIDEPFYSRANFWRQLNLLPYQVSWINGAASK